MTFLEWRSFYLAQGLSEIEADEEATRRVLEQDNRRRINRKEEQDK